MQRCAIESITFRLCVKCINLVIFYMFKSKFYPFFFIYIINNDMKTVISTDKAPAAIGPYNQAIVHNGIVYCSGQIPLDPKTGEFVGTTVDVQAEQVMKNLDAVLTAAGTDFSKVIKCSIFLADMGDFAVINEIYGRFFKDNAPARETVAVKTLPKNALIEISCIAHL